VLEALRIYAGAANLKLLKEIAESHDESSDIDLTKTERDIRSYIFFKNYEDLFSDRKYQNSRIEIGDNSSEKIWINKKIDTNGNKESMFISAFFNEKRCSVIPTKFITMEELEKEWQDIELTDNEEIVTQALQIIVPNFQRLSFEGKVLFSEFSDRIYDPNKKNQSYDTKEPLPNSKLWVKIKLKNNPKPVPLKSLGDGMLRILQIAIKLVSAQGGFLLIDEFENGLHYSVQENVWRLLFEMAEKLDIQVFATTHSWDCIESFTKVALENETTEGILFRMGKSALTKNKGQVIATVYDKEALYEMTEINMELR
jgi:AAA15 family ATPase/GTPase